MQVLWQLSCDEQSMDSALNGKTKLGSSNKLDWDDIVPEEFLKEWEKFSSNLYFLEKISIPRYLFEGTDNLNIELHGFCDASCKAYGAVIYCRTIDSKNKASVRLL